MLFNGMRVRDRSFERPLPSGTQGVFDMSLERLEWAVNHGTGQRNRLDVATDSIKGLFFWAVKAEKLWDL